MCYSMDLQGLKVPREQGRSQENYEWGNFIDKFSSQVFMVLI